MIRGFSLKLIHQDNTKIVYLKKKQKNISVQSIVKALNESHSKNFAISPAMDRDQSTFLSTVLFIIHTIIIGV